MDSLFPACLDFTLANEGGFSDNPADPGGATFKGITLASLRDYWGDPDGGPRLLFKGGTSLSKGFGLISRFSEDIDVTVFREDLRVNATVEDLRGLDPETISWFYQQRFWSPMQCGVLPAGIDLMIFDHGVNVGKARPVPMMQRLLAVDDDGIVGPITLAAISARTPLKLIGDLRGEQEAYYRALREFPTFGNGWLNRLSRRFTAATRFAEQAVQMNKA